MSDLMTFTPLRAETVDTIRARMDASVNAGLDPDDPRWQDTTPGGFFYDHTQSFALEAEYLWDYASTELVASFFLPFSWGIYLDYWGELLGVPRKAEAAATGEVTFSTTSTTDVPVAAGIRVAAPATSPDEDPREYVVTTGGVIPAGGSVTLPVQAADAGSAFNASAGAVTLVVSPLTSVTATNALPMTGGADEEADEPYKARLLLEFSQPRGGGTKADYIAAVLTDPSVGNAVVEPVWAGPGTVRVIVSDPNNDPVSDAVVDRLQARLDPVPANGEGEAPINATVTVATTTGVAIAVAATVAHETGFSLDGGGGLEATRATITAAVQAYIDSLEPGRDVQLSRVQAAVLGVKGVYEVSGVTINGVAADQAIAALEVAQLTTPLSLS